ncbi:MAG TPA: BatA domain-containing protein [Ignavibacteria bacterium]|nr:BatA domain-containing protein [Ignavibacteria bacterium]HRF66413.1 BatA domain-containing protein [Ignavibacteria bacterium]HRJ05600.1 BatA domain-containing protein [Ignavibacteria bacterium]
MTFLNPLLLWGLAAVSIPILIHIFNLKRTKKIEFSTLMFLKEIQQSKYKKIKLKQLLILLCRIAFIIFLVMMFAKPFDSGFLGTPGEKAKSSVLIILDDSFSMQSRDKSGNDFESGKKKVTEIIDALGTNDELFFTTVSGLNAARSTVPYKDFSVIKDTLTQLKTSEVTRDINEVLYYAESILNSASNTHKEVYLVTDGQLSFLRKDLIPQSGFKGKDILHFSVILTGSRNANNISLDTVNVVSKIFEKARPVKIKAKLNNHNNFNSVNKSVIISYGNHKEEKVLDIPANTTVETEFIIKPEAAGFSSGSIELVQNDIADDEISGDNRQYFSFYIPEKVNVLLASGSPMDAEYVKLVLTTSAQISASTEISTLFNIREINASDISGENLGSYNSVVIINKPSFSAGEVNKLKEYIDAGGGAVIYPGALSDISNYNNTLMKELDLPYIGGKYYSETPVKFEKIDYDHPVFEGIFRRESDKNNAGIESPELISGFSLSGGKNALSIVTLTNGTNFMEEYSRGKGKLIMFASAPDMSAGNFPVKNLFSPVTIRSILYTSNINGIRPAIAGKDYYAELNRYEMKSDTLLISSAGENAPEFIVTNEQTQLLNLGSTLNNTGIYSVINSGRDILRVPVNFNAVESQTGRMKPGDIEVLFNDTYALNANVVSPEDVLTAAVIDLRTGKDLWQYFLILAVIFLIIEYLLSRSIMRNK